MRARPSIRCPIPPKTGSACARTWLRLRWSSCCCVFGAWLIERLSAYSRTLACIEFGHRSCLKLDVGQLPPR